MHAFLKQTLKNGRIELEIEKKLFEYDFLILGTGYAINGFNQEEFKKYLSHIALWKDRGFPMNCCNQNLGFFPFLGPSFEFVEKNAGQAPYLKNIHCFNFASILSHGRLSTDIESISLGAQRLAQGIAADFFRQQSDHYLSLVGKVQSLD